MRLVYTEGPKQGQEVKVGDRVHLERTGECSVEYFREPHKPSSEGKVSVQSVPQGCWFEYYVSVIGAEWIEREDRKAAFERGEDY